MHSQLRIENKLKLEHHSSLLFRVWFQVMYANYFHYCLCRISSIRHLTIERTCICCSIPEVYFPCQWKLSCSLPILKRKYCILAEWAGAIRDLYCHHDCVECSPLFANCSVCLLLVIRRVLTLVCKCVRYFLRHHNLSAIGRPSSCYV
jgi:hypothetical protein